MFLSLLGIVTFYVSWRLAVYAAGPALPLGAVPAVAAFSFMALVMPLTTELLVPAAYTDRRARNVIRMASWAVMTFQGMFLCLLFYTLAVDLAGLIWRGLSPETPEASIDHTLFLALTLLTGGTTALGLAQGAAEPRLFRTDIPIDNLPRDLDGFTIAQISDLHVGPLLGAPYVARVVKRVNALHPDMVALTGDFVDGRVEHLKHDVSPLSHLRAREGVFFVTGNHECYWSSRAWSYHFSGMGFRVLWNAHYLIRRGAAKLAVAGVTDWSTRGRRAPDGYDPARAAAGIPPDAVKILLAHQPNSYAEAERLGFDLQLSGHTHGGQFFPWSLVVGLFHRYYTGLHRHGRLWVYVSRGTGFWGPPLRAGVPAEITLLTLRSK
jgi:predicted MPP superfamily phosphohydrolase